MNAPILLCTDLDRTLIPNGHAAESPRVRDCFRQLVQRPEITLAYVSGRHLALVVEALEEYQLPAPDYILADVGSTLYEHHPADKAEPWRANSRWWQTIAADWGEYGHDELAGLFTDLAPLQLQEPEKQNRFKLSYYLADPELAPTLIREMEQRLKQRDIKANLIWSMDEMIGRGLLDLLPQSASKLHGIRSLMTQGSFDNGHTFFAGDSGNDLAVITSPIPSVLVANATEEVRKQALQQAAQYHTEAALYLARGDLPNMNGNYAAGLLEGFCHFYPGYRPWLEEQYQRLLSSP